MTIDVRKADERFHPHRLAGLVALVQLRHPLRPGEHPSRSAPREQRRSSGARTRLHHALPPGHGDRHVGARGRAGPPGHHRHRRDHPTGRGAAHERRAGIAHSEMNASAAKASTSCRCGFPRHRGDRASYEQTDVSDDLATGGLVPVAGGPDQDAAVTIQQSRRRPVGRPAAARRGERSPPATRPRVRRPAAPPSRVPGQALATSPRPMRASWPDRGRRRRRDTHLGHRLSVIRAFRG